jgi:hypothetical protein
MKNYSKKGRSINYFKTDKGRYSTSANAKSLWDRNFLEKQDLASLEIKLKFLKKYKSDDKLSISKCQKLINSKKKQQ